MTDPLKYIYQIEFPGGKTATCTSPARVHDALHYFRNRFGQETVLSVAERSITGEWVDSTMLPTCSEEGEAIADSAIADMKARIRESIGKYHTNQRRERR